MTLITGISYKDQFVLLGADSKVTKQYHDAFSFEKDDRTEETGIHHDKVRLLTNFVLLSTGGVVKTGEIVEKELIKRIQPDYTLDKCAEILQEVVTELWNKKKTWEQGGESDKDSLSLNFIGTKYFSCVMFGFLSNGRTGMAYINPESITVMSQDSPMERGTACVIISPDLEDNTNYLSWIDLPKEEQTLQNYMQQFLLIHSKLSLKHSHSVSPDCNMFLLMKNEAGQVQYVKTTYDSSVLYPMFDENPDIDHTKLWKMYK